MKTLAREGRRFGEVGEEDSSVLFGFWLNTRAWVTPVFGDLARAATRTVRRVVLGRPWTAAWKWTRPGIPPQPSSLSVVCWSPLLAFGARVRVARISITAGTRRRRRCNIRRHPALDTVDADIMLYGRGRFGSHIAHRLTDAGHAVLAVEFNPDIVNPWNRNGVTTVFGSAEDIDFLETLPWVVPTG